MKNILKITLVLFSVFALTSANAGTLTVTGNAKASYSVISSEAKTLLEFKKEKLLKKVYSL